jgi:hypothetical protein
MVAAAKCDTGGQNLGSSGACNPQVSSEYLALVEVGLYRELEWLQDGKHHPQRTSLNQVNQTLQQKSWHAAHLGPKKNVAL